MKRILILCLCFILVLLVGCEKPGKEPFNSIDTGMNRDPIVNHSEEQLEEEKIKDEIFIENKIEREESIKEEDTQKLRYRIEIPNQLERATLPNCDGLQFTTNPVNINEVTAITPLGNIGPPGHTFPTQHPHLHMGEHNSGRSFDIFAPADVYLTAIAWSESMSSDPRDYTIYFALCDGVIAYYNHVKTISPELQAIVDKYKCEDFASGSTGCTKVLQLDKYEDGKLMGTVGLKQGNWDFGLIDLRKPLDFINPLRQPERDRYLQCAFDYYPKQMRDKFYSLLLNEDGTCGKVMQDVAGTLKGDWYHESANAEYVVDWDVFLAFVNDWQFSKAQVVSIAGKFTNPSKYQFNPKSSGTINREFADVTNDGNIYCYQGEDIGRPFEKIPAGKVIVQMVDDNTLKIEHKIGDCSGTENFNNPEVYKR